MSPTLRAMSWLSPDVLLTLVSPLAGSPPSRGSPLAVSRRAGDRCRGKVRLDPGCNPRALEHAGAPVKPLTCSDAALLENRLLIGKLQPAVGVDEAAIHDRVGQIPGLGPVDDGLEVVRVRDKLRVVEVKHDKVGSFARLDRADLV